MDEFLERLIDRVCESVSRRLRSLKERYVSSALGWRISLYTGTAKRKIGKAFSYIKNEENVDKLMRMASEREDEEITRLKQWMKRLYLRFVGIEKNAQKTRFGAMLFMMLLSVLGVVQTRQRLMAFAAAALCAMWVSSAIESDYAPISGAIRQQHIAATIMRALASLLMTIGFFLEYVSRGVPSNVVLQSAMIALLTIHGVMYMAFILLNTRQPLFLRALAGVLGAVPALMAAAAVSLAAACIFGQWPLPLSGAAGALGALLFFLSDQLINLNNLGGIRLKYYLLWVCLLQIGGFALMLAGVWIYLP
ncbi:MAG: hypothetical protein IJD60_04630 [Clostridia bacterium]|nr:hypothetical protein [Clostridia bacterium]